MRPILNADPLLEYSLNNENMKNTIRSILDTDKLPESGNSLDKVIKKGQIRPLQNALRPILETRNLPDKGL